jgi:hypothetical protein
MNPKLAQVSVDLGFSPEYSRPVQHCNAKWAGKILLGKQSTIGEVDGEFELNVKRGGRR